jgi:hypothetical protein
MSKNGTELVLIRYVVRVFLRVRDMDYAIESHREEFEASRLKTILTAETSKMSILCRQLPRNLVLFKLTSRLTQISQRQVEKHITLV